jgi:hypothetical protein
MQLITIVLTTFIIILIIIIYRNGELYTNNVKINNLEENEYYDSDEGSAMKTIIQSDKFKLDLDYKYYAGDSKDKKETIDILTNEFKTVLDSDKFKILDLYDGSIIIDIKFNDDNLYDKFVSLINDTSSSVYKQPLLKYIDTSYLVRNDNLSPIIPKPLNIIDQLVNDNTPFMLSVTVPTLGVYSPDMKNPPQSKDVKLYLTVANTNKNYSTCVNTSGMLSLQEKPTTGSIFTLNSVIKYVPKNTYPYDFIDYINTYFEKKDNSDWIESIFYELRAYGSYNNVSFCMQDCQEKNGFCAQENRSNNVSKKNGIGKKDEYGIKNYMKFIIEDSSKNIVTPYFVSLDPNEKIHFLTNNYNTIINKNGYKQLVQVPIYEDKKRPYYKMPIYDTSTKELKDKEVVIKKLNQVLTDFDTDAYARKNTMTIEETQVKKNDAYLKYALKFTIEKLTPKQIKTMSK